VLVLCVYFQPFSAVLLLESYDTSDFTSMELGLKTALLPLLMRDHMTRCQPNHILNMRTFHFLYTKLDVSVSVVILLSMMNTWKG